MSWIRNLSIRQYAILRLTSIAIGFGTIFAYVAVTAGPSVCN